MKRYPFKFLDAYGREDTDIFFGRDEEIEMLYEMVFQSSIILIYGASGTGKTSLVQCGLASKFQSHDWLALTIRRGSNINTSLEKMLNEAGGNSSKDDEMDWLEEVMSEEELTTQTKKLSPLAQSLKAIYLDSFKPVYLIFDQFEELFVLGSVQEQQQFIETVKEILKLDQTVKMIFSIREEYLGHLNRFEREVPQLLRKKLRVEPMNLDKVRQVIIGATRYKHSNVRLKEGETDMVAEAIFDKIKGNQKTLNIQLPYLQVFLDKLYLKITGDETRQAEAVITMLSLNEIGDIGDVLSNFLEEQVSGISKKMTGSFPGVSVEAIWKILSPFATLEGTKEPISKPDLYDRLPDLSLAMIDEAIELFINSRILRYADDVDLFEIAHDSLAKRIAEKRSDEEIALLEIKRLIKSQTSLKEDARELFSEKQLNFIEPFLNKIKLTGEEKNLISLSREAVALQKAAEREAQDAEAQRIIERQQLLERSQRAQKRFIRWISFALIIMIGLAFWALNQKAKNERTLVSLQQQRAQNEKTLVSLQQQLDTNKILQKRFDSVTNVLSKYFDTLQGSNSTSDDAQQERKVQTLVRSLKSISEYSAKFNETLTYRQASNLEKEAFAALINNDFSTALQKFNNVEKVYPSFHQAYEISRLLKKNKDHFTDAEDQKQIKSEIVTKYSWGAPADLINKLKDQVKQ